MTASPYRSCEVTLRFADGEYLFRLPLKRIAELEEKCAAPIGAIWKRVCITGEYHAIDLIETVRLGLIGGGLPALEARDLIDRYCDTWPLVDWHKHAIAILGVCVEGYAGTDPDEDEPKKQAAAGEAGSTSPRATASGSKRASRRKPSQS